MSIQIIGSLVRNIDLQETVKALISSRLFYTENSDNVDFGNMVLYNELGYILQINTRSFILTAPKVIDLCEAEQFLKEVAQYFLDKNRERVPYVFRLAQWIGAVKIMPPSTIRLQSGKTINNAIILRSYAPVGKVVAYGPNAGTLVGPHVGTIISDEHTVVVQVSLTFNNISTPLADNTIIVAPPFVGIVNQVGSAAGTITIDSHKTIAQEEQKVGTISGE